MTRALISELSDLIGHWDDLFQHRMKTKEVAARVFGHRLSRTCAICGTSARTTEAAHVKPLAEGGTTDTEGANLIPLCHGLNLSKLIWNALSTLEEALAAATEEQERKEAANMTLGKAIETMGCGRDAVGCHELYDHGLIAESTIQDIRKDPDTWGKQGEVRQKALDFLVSALGPEYDPGTNRQRKSRTLRTQVANFTVKTYQRRETADEKNVFLRQLCDCISVHRRTWNQRDFRLAKAKASLVAQLLELEHDAVLATKADLLLYEWALVEMTDSRDPRLGSVRRLLRRSCRAARTSGNQRGWSMSALEWVHAVTLGAQSISERQFNILSQIQEHAVSTLMAAPGDASVHTGRWPINALMHRAQLCLKVGKIQKAVDASTTAWSIRAKSHLGNGRRVFQGVHLLTIDALTACHRKQPKEALRLLARALSIMRAARGKRPEGYKDIALCAAWALAQIGEVAAETQAARIAASMVDGRSGFWMEPSTA